MRIASPAQRRLGAETGPTEGARARLAPRPNILPNPRFDETLGGAVLQAHAGAHMQTSGAHGRWPAMPSPRTSKAHARMRPIGSALSCPLCVPQENSRRFPLRRSGSKRNVQQPPRNTR